MSCYTRCFKRPLIIFVAIVVLLLILAIIFCLFAKDGKCCANEVASPKEHNIVKEKVVPKQEKVDYLVEVKRKFIKEGVVSSGFTTKEQIFFAKSSSKANDEAMKAFHQATKDNIGNARLVIISGHACDLGKKSFNDILIQKRINFAINDIKSRNPAIEILFSNEGQTKINHANNADIELERKQERRVDIYFYK